MKLLLVLALLVGLWLLLRPRPKRPVGDMSAARAVLGVGPEADADAIRAAHRRLLSTVHPDRGGSAELTRQINAARDTLLRR